MVKENSITHNESTERISKTVLFSDNKNKRVVKIASVLLCVRADACNTIFSAYLYFLLLTINNQLTKANSGISIS